jgi:hypothetical protein
MVDCVEDWPGQSKESGQVPPRLGTNQDLTELRLPTILVVSYRAPMRLKPLVVAVDSDVKRYCIVRCQCRKFPECIPADKVARTQE